MIYQVVVLSSMTSLLLAADNMVTIDKNGYVMYCPCMGRFGNQAEHFLGSLAFAKQIGRTLVLPPWPTLKGYIPFDDWFHVKVLETYNNVIPAERFMDEVAPIVWPVGKRIGLCYTPYQNSKHKCQLKEGSPFGPFWDNLQVDFDTYEFYTLSYHDELSNEWRTRYPASEYPVLALRGAPASFPAHPDHVKLQKYLWWTDVMVAEASQFIYTLFGDDKYIAIHLRNGEDWERACDYAVGQTKTMSSPQCTGYESKEMIGRDMCLPDISIVIRDIRQALIDTGLKNVYVLTDQYPMIHQIEEALSDLGVKAIHGDPDIPQIDLIIASRAELFIGNCVSSFSAFIKRERDHVTEKPSRFFGYPQSNLTDQIAN